jgi:P4 family phage/plasmid primase-like protien
MTLITFLNNNNIKWFPIDLEINLEKKTKKPLPIKHNFYGYGMPKMTDFKELTDREIKNRQTLADKYDYIAIDTTDIQQVDVDNPETDFSLKDQAPYYLSATKKLPHYFVRVNRAEAFKNREGWVDDPKIELLNSQWAYAKRDIEIINPESDVPTFEWKSWKKQESVKPKSPVSVQPKSPVEDFINMASVKLDENENDYSDQIPGLTELGFTNIKFKNDRYNFGCDQIGGVCPLCDGQHTSNHYFLFQRGGLWFVKNHSDGCVETKLPCSKMEEICNDFKNGRASHELFAKLFKIGYRDKLAYSGKYWYKLNEGGLFRKLEEDADVIIGIEMNHYCSEVLLKLVAETTDDDKKKHLYQALAKFQNHTFKMNCISASRMEFHKLGLADELDLNPNLLGFENGVYDLQNDTFRVATIDDKVSLSVGYDYDDTANTDIEVFEELINGYFEAPETARWFKKHLGSLICGGNPEEKAYFWTGYGRNGKGTVEGLVRYALGEYYTTVNREFYTDRRKGSGPQPEVIMLRNKRVGMTAETESDEKFILGAFKGLTGGEDTLKARELHSNKHHEFSATHKTIIQTNHLPGFTGNDDGILCRVLPITFDYQFMSGDVYDEKNPKHKKVDMELKQKLKKHHKSFIHFLIRWHKVYRDEGLDFDNLPPAIEESAKRYRDEIDTVGTFVKKGLVQTGKESDAIPLEDVRKYYNTWAPHEHLNDKVFSQRLRQSGLEAKRKTINHRKLTCIVGVRMDEDFKKEYPINGFGADF